MGHLLLQGLFLELLLRLFLVLFGLHLLGVLRVFFLGLFLGQQLLVDVGDGLFALYLVFSLGLFCDFFDVEFVLFFEIDLFFRVLFVFTHLFIYYFNNLSILFFYWHSLI